ncbi:hypothetical protein [Streptomyces tauricus]
MFGAIRKEAGGNRGLESDAAAVVLEAIRRRFGDHVDSVRPSTRRMAGQAPCCGYSPVPLVSPTSAACNPLHPPSLRPAHRDSSSGEARCCFP